MSPPDIAEIAHEKVEMLLGSVGRYTQFVRSAKLMLAVFVAALTGIVLLYPVIHKDAGGTRIAFTSITKKGNSEQTVMMSPKYHGLDKDNQPFNFNAKTSTQLDDDTMGLDHPVGDITLKNGAWLSVAGNDGIFKMKERLLDLKGSIEMFNDGGYEFRTEKMHVNVGNKTAVTQTPVDGQGPLGTLKAYGGATIYGQQDRIDFAGPIFVTVYPAHDDDKTKTGKAKP